ncbi:DUF551 domain-containing protein [Actinobacillus equuli subsp. haemolyticus]|nr:DUF551 domain-containing protein [Actinobacillus equuli subsp. haemolyticus]
MTKKYFSVDVSNDTHVVELHETLEQAKQKCLDSAESAYDSAADTDDFINFEGHDLPFAVYGVVLGKAESGTRPLTEEEVESGYYDGYDYIIEQPKLVEVNNWISVKDELPDEDIDVLIYGYKRSEFRLVSISFYSEGKFNLPDSFTITHWQPLPEPPKS